MKKLILLLVPISVYCQSNNDYQAVQGKDLVMTKSSKNDSSVDGSPYINANYQLAKISGNEKKYMIRYNAYADEMEFQDETGIKYINKSKNLIVVFLQTNKIYTCKESPSKNGKAELKYFVQLVSNPNKYSLYKKEYIKLVSGIDGLNSYQSSRNDYFEKQKDEFYIEFNGTLFQLAPSAIKNFTEASAKANTYIVRNKPKFTEKDMMKMVEFLNSN